MLFCALKRIRCDRVWRSTRNFALRRRRTNGEENSRLSPGIRHASACPRIIYCRGLVGEDLPPLPPAGSSEIWRRKYTWLVFGGQNKRKDAATNLTASAKIVEVGRFDPICLRGISKICVMLRIKCGERLFGGTFPKFAADVLS